FRTLAVVGAGNMGSGIAQKMATEGFDVVLVDVDEERVARGLKTIDRMLAEAVERRVTTADRAAATRARVRGTPQMEAVAKTDPEVVRRAWTLQERMRKIPIASRDAYGFIVNRFFVVWMMEAVRMLEEGIANEATIDAIAKEAFGIGMGPFELMNVTGIPIA